MTKLVAFLQGINVGKRRIKMDDLRTVFAGAGFADAQTLIASGNVLFSGDDDPALSGELETALEAAFGFNVPVIIRTLPYLQQMVHSNPFADYPGGEVCKLYVYFLGAAEADKVPLDEKVEGDYEIAGRTERDVFAVGWRMDNGRFGEGLDTLAKRFDAPVTNRNWNTVLRMIDKAGT